MEPKIILVPFGGGALEQAALETAFHLAKAWKAHVAVWHVMPDPEELVTTYAAFGMGIPYYPDESSFSELMKLNEKSKKEAHLKFLKTIKKMKIAHEDNPEKAKGASASFHTAIGHAEKIISVQGRLADLIVMSRNPGENVLYDEIVHAALFDSGRPVLVVPPGESAKPLNGKTLIAWNGSREAAHAVAAAFPFLQPGKVWALTGESDHWDEPPLLPQDLVAYLRQHGIAAEALMPWISGTPLPKVILDSAKKLGAGMIVMGAYSHSRMREMILGGVTEYMLKNTNIPVLMAH